MHPINKLFNAFGLQISKSNPASEPPKEFLDKYYSKLNELRKNSNGTKIHEAIRYQAGKHTESYIDAECAFGAFHLGRTKPEKILDIGSYRRWLLGLLAYKEITTIDVRDRTPYLKNENAVTCDAKKLSFSDNEFDAVVTLCAIAHFGFGRYGDEFDMEADKTAMNEMKRVLKPGGRLILTTIITRGEPCIVFNSHRMYSHDMIKSLCEGLVCEEEKFFSHQLGRYCEYNEVVTDFPKWDSYFGCWKKV